MASLFGIAVLESAVENGMQSTVGQGVRTIDVGKQVLKDNPVVPNESGSKDHPESEEDFSFPGLGSVR